MCIRDSNHLYGDEDPDTAIHGGYPRGTAYLWKKLGQDAIGWNAWKTFAYFFGAPARDLRARRSDRPDVAAHRGAHQPQRRWRGQRARARASLPASRELPPRAPPVPGRAALPAAGTAPPAGRQGRAGRRRGPRPGDDAGHRLRSPTTPPAAARDRMTELVLHHYATSPFSEKVRLVLGMKRMPWRSVTVPVMMPKPDVVALTGGYRRTPFMQIGADVYCDSALMCRVIDRLRPEPPLYPHAAAGLAEIVAQWADTTLFWTAVPYTMQPAGVAHIFAKMPAEAVKAFGADRAAMNPSMRRAPIA